MFLVSYNFLVLPVMDSCFPQGPVLIPSTSNVLSKHFTTQDTTFCLDLQRKK